MKSAQPQRRATPWWAGADPLPWRACLHCDHGCDLAGERHCGNPAVIGAGRPRPVALVRSTSGACGVEARHMHSARLHIVEARQ